MNRSIHVLISSISKKVPLIKAVRTALKQFDKKSAIFGADLDANCIGKYFVDTFWHMPPFEKLTKENILEYCKKNQINAIIPTRDAELETWSIYQPFLLEHGIHVMISKGEAIKICRNKQLFCQLLTKNQINTPNTSQNIEELPGELFVVKENSGSGSKGIGIKLNKQEALLIAKNLKEPIFQPFIEGEEYTVDMYIEKDKTIKGVIARKRVLVVDGESQITETCRNLNLEELSKKTAKLLDLRGHVLFQIIQDKLSNNYQIIECNPRFGGASTLSIAAGLDSFCWFFQEVLNEKLPEFKRFPNEIRLIRHAEDTIIRL